MNRFVLTILLTFVPSLAWAAGFPTVTLTHTASEVTSTSSITVPSNLDRSWLLLINDSDTVLYCKFDAAAVVNEGLRIEASGGTLEISASKGNLSNKELRCITSAAPSKTMLVTEGE